MLQNPAFATTPSLESDLAAFYRACQSAPRLRMFDNDTSIDLTLEGMVSLYFNACRWETYV